MRTLILRDRARHGVPQDFLVLQELGYDLTKKCTPQMDGTVLHAAAQYGKHRNCMALIEMGLDPSHRVHPQGPSAMDEALINLHFTLFERLLKRSGPISESDKKHWLAAALSKKVRKLADGNDHPRTRCLKYVLEKFTPDQQTLDEALVIAAGWGWPKAFTVLTKTGAQPQEMTLTNPLGKGNTQLLLFSKSKLDDWGYVLRNTPSNLDLLFPKETPGDQGELKQMTLQVIYQHLAQKSPRAFPELDQHLSLLESQHRQAQLQTTLPEPMTPSKGKKPRF